VHPLKPVAFSISVVDLAHRGGVLILFFRVVFEGKNFQVFFQEITLPAEFFNQNNNATSSSRGIIKWYLIIELFLLLVSFWS